MTVFGSNENKRKYNSGYFPSTDYRVDLKESKNRDKHLNLARKLKKLWNMTVVPVVIRAREADVKSRGGEKRKVENL